MSRGDEPRAPQTLVLDQRQRAQQRHQVFDTPPALEANLQRDNVAFHRIVEPAGGEVKIAL